MVAVLEDAKIHKSVAAVNLSGSNLFILGIGAETLKLQNLGGYGNLALNVIGHNDNGIFVLGNKFPGAVLTFEDRSELIEVALVENLAILLLPPLQKTLQQVTNKLQRMILQPFHPFFTVLVMISSCNALLRKTK